MEVYKLFREVKLDEERRRKVYKKIHGQMTSKAPHMAMNDKAKE